MYIWRWKPRVAMMATLSSLRRRTFPLILTPLLTPYLAPWQPTSFSAYCTFTWCIIVTLIAGQPTVLPPRALCHRPCISTTHTGKHALLCRVGLRIRHEGPSEYLWQCYRWTRICYSPKYHGSSKQSLPNGELHNCGHVCQKQVSWAGTSNYIPQIARDVITCPCP